MTPNDQCKRDDQRPVPVQNLQVIRHPLGRERDHHGDTQEADDEGKLEALPNSGDFYPE